MKTMSKKTLWIGLACAGVLALSLAAVLPRAGAQESYEARRLLARDVAKLAIVVMANQTPISPAEAAEVLPALQAIRDTEAITEANAPALQAGLQSALSPALGEALDQVRLPEAPAEVRARLLERVATHVPGGMLQNPVRSGPGSRAFGLLLEFFAQTAGD